MSTCIIEGCEKPIKYPLNSWCNSHYMRWRRYGDPNAKINRRKPNGLNIEETLNYYILKKSEDECWPWQGATHKYGYGKFTINGKTFRATRIIVEIELGTKLSREDIVMHTCDNPSCCNPAHLVVGTQEDNVWDMMAKGRGHWQKGVG